MDDIKPEFRIEVSHGGAITRLWVGGELFGMVRSVEFIARSEQALPLLRVTLLDVDPALPEKLAKIRKLPFAVAEVVPGS